MSDLATMRVRLAQNLTNSGLSKTDFHNLLILKSPEIFSFGDNLTHLGLKSDIPVSIDGNVNKRETDLSRSREDIQCLIILFNQIGSTPNIFNK